MPGVDKAKHVSKCLETAILLEVSANKPGNVNLAAGFEGTRVEHFLASAVAASASFEEAAKRGIAVSKGRLKMSEAGVGQLIKNCVTDIAGWQTGGNTLLGTVMLFVPFAVAAGLSPMKDNEGFDLVELRRNVKRTVESTTAYDAVHLYEAIAIANPSGLNEAPDLDVNSPESKARLIEENVSLFEVFKIASGYDDICYEWVNNCPIAFELGYPYIIHQLKTNTLNTAIIHTFLKILSERPDTFISRKVGVKNAKKISNDARHILQLGGMETPKGRESVRVFDRKLRAYGNNFNPGTTADLTAATLSLCTLSGFRP